MEIWKAIQGYETTHVVSNMGNVKRVNGSKNYKVTKHRTGYIHFWINAKAFRAHRLVAMAFLPNPDNHPVVNHINGIKTDNRVENLEWCSVSDNNKHAFNTGLASNAGENHSQNKLTEDQIVEIKILKGKMKQKEIAELFGVAQSTISMIMHNKRWNTVLN